MEELQSTEVLDREILEDARKKALRILKSSEDAIKAQDSEWENKTTENINKIKEKYALLIKHEEERVMARLPIDKLRSKIEKIENLLQAALEYWFKSLSRAQVLKLLSRELAKRLAVNSDLLAETNKKFRASFFGIEKQEAKELLKSFHFNCDIEENHAAARFPLIMIETEEARITSSVDKILDYLLHVKRAELTAALVGQDFMGEE